MTPPLRSPCLNYKLPMVPQYGRRKDTHPEYWHVTWFQLDFYSCRHKDTHPWRRFPGTLWTGGIYEPEDPVRQNHEHARLGIPTRQSTTGLSNGRKFRIGAKESPKIIRPSQTVSNFLFKFEKCILLQVWWSAHPDVVPSLVVTWISGFEWLRDVHKLIYFLFCVV